MTEKACSKCGAVKPVSEFYRKGGDRPGFRPACKDCHNLTSNNWARNNKELAAANAREWRAGIRERNERATPDMGGMKTCSKCGAEKPKSEFPAAPTRNGGLRPECCACRKAADQKYREDNREKTRESNRAYRATRPEEARARERELRRSKYWYGKEHLRGESWVSRPFVGYRWYWPDGSIAYVGVTSRAVKERTDQHLKASDWVRPDMIPPTEPEIGFGSYEEAQAWEREQVEAAVERGEYIQNTVFNPLR